jgi:hypothetical protein
VADAVPQAPPPMDRRAQPQAPHQEHSRVATRQICSGKSAAPLASPKLAQRWIWASMLRRPVASSLLLVVVLLADSQCCTHAAVDGG